jgi:hypothetical protein
MMNKKSEWVWARPNVIKLRNKQLKNKGLQVILL